MSGKGYQVFEADAVLSLSGEPVVVYSMNIVSNGGAVGKVILRNGTSASSTAIVTINGTIGIGTMHDFGDVGVVFPSGCFVDIDSNTAAATIIFERLK